MSTIRGILLRAMSIASKSPPHTLKTKAVFEELRKPYRLGVLGKFSYIDLIHARHNLPATITDAGLLPLIETFKKVPATASYSSDALFGDTEGGV